MPDEMKTFYVTFGAGSLFRNYHAVIVAKNEDIVRAWLNREKYSWSNCYTEKPRHSKPLQAVPEYLYYSDAEHI